MLVRRVVPIAIVLFAAPLVAVSAAAADPTTETITTHQAYDSSTGVSCSSLDPVLGFASTDLTSSMVATPSGGSTTFTIHLDATQADPVHGRSACAAIDLVLSSPISWPPPRDWTSASFTSTCGLTGAMSTYGGSTQDYVQILFGAAPSECALPITQGFLGWAITPVHRQTALVCGPVVAATCVGAYGEARSAGGCFGSYERLYVVAGVGLAYVHHGCQWQDGRDHVVVADGVGVVALDSTSDSCELSVRDPIGFAGAAEAPCPAEVGAAVYGVDWAHLIP